jgi:predicted nuclease of restriction endonuclease-like (RecB) superfamily
MSKDAAMETTTGELPPDYTGWLASLKQRIRSAQQRAVLAVNRELVLLYWQIGQDILARQQAQGWGAKVIERLARDLSAAFPGMKGFSPRNLKYMRAFAEAWPDGAIVQGVLAQLPWFHLCILLDKVKTSPEREWYVAKAIEHGWSRNILAMQPTNATSRPRSSGMPQMSRRSGCQARHAAPRKDQPFASIAAPNVGLPSSAPNYKRDLAGWR